MAPLIGSTRRNGKNTIRPSISKEESLLNPGLEVTVFMSTYGMQAAYHMKRYGTTQIDRGGRFQNHHMEA